MRRLKETIKLNKENRYKLPNKETPQNPAIAVRKARGPNSTPPSSVGPQGFAAVSFNLMLDPRKFIRMIICH